MEENRKEERKNEEMDPEIMEQVAGGSIPFPTKIRYCGTCRDKTRWTYSGGGYACSACGNRSFGASI